MGLLEKMGLIEREDPIDISVAFEVSVEPQANVDAEIASKENIVEQIFAQNNLADRSDSIYTVQALIATLPDEMTTAKKQNTVSGILVVSGKSVATLIEDATTRIEILKAAETKIVEEKTAEIEDANADIEELKKAIEAATIKIKEAEGIIEQAKKEVGDEIATITGLSDFCAGMEG